MCRADESHDTMPRPDGSSHAHNAGIAPVEVGIAPLRPENVPNDLRERPQWVLWKYELRGKDQDKVPYAVRNGHRASTSDSSTWASFDHAVEKLRAGGYSGIGFVFDREDPFCGIDLDDCTDENGHISSEAQSVINTCASYAEVSPSGTGVKIFARGRKTISDCAGGPFPGIKQIELYDRGRYFTLTGRKVEGVPSECRNAQAELDRLGGMIRLLKSSRSQIDANRMASTYLPTGNVDDAMVRLRAGKYLAAIPGAIAGQNGHSQTFVAAVALVHGFCLSEEEALDLLLREYNPRCQPPWSERELRHKVSDAATKPHDKPRGWLRDSAAPSDIDMMSSFPHNPALTHRFVPGSVPYSSVTTVAVAGCDATSATGVAATVLANELRKQILLDVDEHRVVSETVAALASDDELYQRGRSLVRIARQRGFNDGSIRSAGVAAIELLPIASLRERMTMHANYQRSGTKGPVSAHPPQWLVNAVAARGQYPDIRILNGISEVPILRPDGSLCQTPGYDFETGVVYEPSEEFPLVPDDVGLDDAVAAAAALLDVVCDFRFEDECHKAGWLAALLTPLARTAFRGPAPLFLIDANVRGAGKTLLAQVIAIICSGRDMPVSSYSHETEEMRKKVTAIALAGDRLVQLDNLDGTFGNDTIDRALTATVWRDRVLGKSEMVELPLQAVWYATGNNVAVAADTARRVIHIRLDVLEQRPEDREGFKYPDLLGRVRLHRASMLTYALTILRAYHRAGRPRQNLRPMGTFEGWSDLVRQAVVWLGFSDPCKSRDRLAEQADTSHEALAQVINAWETCDPQRHGLIVANVINDLYQPHGQPTDPASVQMRSALEALVGCPTGRPPTARQVGNKLKHFRRRVIDGRFLDATTSNRSGTVWRVNGARPGMST